VWGDPPAERADCNTPNRSRPARKHLIDAHFVILGCLLVNRRHPAASLVAFNPQEITVLAVSLAAFLRRPPGLCGDATATSISRREAKSAEITPRRTFRLRHYRSHWQI